VHPALPKDFKLSLQLWPGKMTSFALISIFDTGEETIMKWLRNTGRNLGVAGELFGFFASNKRWWMIPMIIVLFVLGALIILAQSPAVAPFIYTLF
jgi:hypothetical protein